MNNTYKCKKHLHIGLGGIKCPCCFPQSSSGKKIEYRLAKRREVRENNRDIKQQIKDLYEE